MTATSPLLSVKNLSVDFDTPNGPVSALRNISLTLKAGRTVAIVGESGSGKSTFAAAINGLLSANGRVTEGQIQFEGQDITGFTPHQWRQMRGAKIGLVPQDPMTNLNPLQRVGTQIAEALEVHGLAGHREALQKAVELLDMVGIPEPARRARQYPHEMSGGMRQRVLIAMGLACKPRLLIADEPTSALDVLVQRTILDELHTLTSQLGTALILITHDLALAAERADDVLVMFRGDVMETGPAPEVMRNPKADYTRRLIAAAPSMLEAPEQKAAAAPKVPSHTEVHPRALVEFLNVRKTYPITKGWFEKSKEFVAVDNSSFTIERGETVAIVGGSGSGKSTTARLLLKIEDVTSGDIVFEGKQITALTKQELFSFRRRVQPVFQNPFGSLDARFTIEQSIAEPLILHGIGDAAERRARVCKLLDQVALPRQLAYRKPSEISGGQSQRVAIARALALEPKLIVLDEAVSALDVLVQEQILDLLQELQHETDVAYLFISHDLAVVRQIADTVHVMNKGRIVESGAPDDLFFRPQNAFTQELVTAIPQYERH